MLEHEPQETPAPQITAPIPAAQRRVSAEELTRAVSALEDAKAAERIAGVAPIGQVVDELGLDSTPEEIWAQVEKQRAQRAAEEAARTAPVATPSSFFETPPRPRRRRRWWVGAGVVLIIWGFAHNATVQTAPPAITDPSSAITITNPDSAITISGEDQTETIPAQGKDVVIEGEDNNITLTGQARSVTISGEDNKVQGDAPKTFVSQGEDNTAKWNSAP